jgi:hypothetical protein
VGAVFAALVATLGAVVLAPAAQAYPESVCTYAVQPQTLVGGGPVTVTGTSTVSHHWRFRLDDSATAGGRPAAGGSAQDATGTGTTFSHTFRTPKVKTRTTVYVHASCDGGGVKVLPVTLDPAGAGLAPGQGAALPDHNGILPGTGGPGLWLLLAALALLLVGLGISSVRRRAPQDPWASI